MNGITFGQLSDFYFPFNIVISMAFYLLPIFSIRHYFLSVDKPHGTAQGL